MDRAAIAKACEVEETWLDGWSGEGIGVYPTRLLDTQSGTYWRGTANPDAPGTWMLVIGVRTKPLTSLQAARIRYALDRLGVKYFERAPVRRPA